MLFVCYPCVGKGKRTDGKITNKAINTQIYLYIISIIGKNMKNSNPFKKRLSGIIHDNDIQEITYLTQGKQNDRQKEALYELLFDTDKRTSNNAAWVFTHFDLHNNEWLYNKHDELINEVMKTNSQTKCRLILTLLNRQPFVKEKIRTDFLDFCLKHMTDANEATGIRCMCMKLAYEQCHFFKELSTELKATLEMMEPDFLGPGIRTTRKNILKKLE